MPYRYAILILLLNSCNHYPVSTIAEINKTSLIHGEEVAIKVTAKNNSSKQIATPILVDLKPSKGFSSERVNFKPDTPLNSDFYITRDSISTNYTNNIPVIESGESKAYIFYWSPAHYDQGEGSLSISLPDNFQPIKPFRISIKPRKMQNKSQ